MLPFIPSACPPGITFLRFCREVKFGRRSQGLCRGQVRTSPTALPYVFHFSIPLWPEEYSTGPKSYPRQRWHEIPSFDDNGNYFETTNVKQILAIARQCLRIILLTGENPNHTLGIPLLRRLDRNLRSSGNFLDPPTFAPSIFTKTSVSGSGRSVPK